MSCISINLIAVLRLYYKDEANKISESECKKFEREARITKISVKRDRRLTGVKREKLPASESEWVSILRSETVKSVR